MKKVTSSNGAITNEITYQTMEPTNAGNGGLGFLNSFYSSTNSLSYPYVELKKLPNSYIVSQVKNTVNNQSLYQDFKYHGLMVHLKGYGSLGFKKTARSEWYVNSGDKKIWAVTERETGNRGAVTRKYSQLNTASFSFVSSGLPTNTINETKFNYVSYAVNNIYYLLTTSIVTNDYLTNTASTIGTNYGTYSTYLLPAITTSNKYNSLNLINPVSTTTTTTVFDNNPGGSGADYHIGRPLEITSTTTAYGDTATSFERFTYTNNKLIKKETRGNTTENKFLVEEYEYNPVGNIKKKTISSIGYSGTASIAPRSTEYTYDASERFVKTTKDVEGLISTNVSYHPIYGLLTEAKDPFDRTLKNYYDFWGKKYKTEDYLGNKIVYNYSRNTSNNTLQVVALSDDGSETITVTDLLGRTILSGKKNINGIFSYVTTEYDAKGRKLRISEPYTGSASQWTTFEYDDYGRLKKQTQPNGVVTSMGYNNRTVSTVVDYLDGNSPKFLSSTKDANGNVVSSSDMGGTINYTYFANGGLRQSTYNGNSVQMQYDEWGRKTQLTDPSAGTYTYSYNALGELLIETTPKGTSTYNLDSATGKLISKTVSGDATNLVSTYAYDGTTKLLTSITSNIGSTYTYEYDSYKRLWRTTEFTPEIHYQTAVVFDSFGRTEKEYQYAHHLATGKTSSHWAKNTFKNGYHWQIIDDVSGTVLWQTDNVNARGQLTEGLYGNGIDMTNTYDTFGFLVNSTHLTSNNTQALRLITDFNTKRGNLNSRFTQISGMDSSENFTYDNLDRLTSWNSTNFLYTYTFNSTVEGFVPTISSVNLSLYTSGFPPFLTSKLKVTSTANFEGTKKLVKTNATIGNVIKFEGQASFTTGKSTVLTENYFRYFVIERNPSTGATVETEYTNTSVLLNSFSFQHTVSQYPEVYLKIVAGSEFSTPSSITFYLDNISISEIQLFSQSYETDGRIKQNNLGTYNYTNTGKKYQNTSINVTPETQAYYLGRSDLDVSYNAFKSPVEIYEAGHDRIGFDYSIFQDRSVMYYGNENVDKMQRRYRKYYSGIGNMEVKYDTQTGDIEMFTYIGGDAYSAPVVLKNNGISQNFLYLHRDYLGSILAISNANGQLVEKRLFDAWGELKEVRDGNNNVLAGLTLLDRGYTGHEHLQSVKLIHMNGRLYDPKLHRFLQPDNFVQDPSNTQNYNRYSYVLNNPLRYNDPSGEELISLTAAVIIGAAIGITGYTMTALLADVPFNAEGLVSSAIMGACSGAMSFGIGEATSAINNFFIKASVEAVAHGTFQGAMSEAQGGKFIQGFASGSLSSIAASAFMGGVSYDGDGCPIEGSGWGGAGNFAGTPGGTLAFGAVMGGAGASLTGGNFWQGAATGLIVTGLNHLGNHIQRKIQIKPVVHYKKGCSIH